MEATGGVFQYGLGGAECAPHAGIMLEEFDLVLRNRNASKKPSKPSPLKSQQLTVRREKDDLYT